MFDKDRYVTIGVKNTLPLKLQLILWKMVETLDVKQDRLQIFVLKKIDDRTQSVTHEQENPEYKHTCYFPLDNPVSHKVYIIDDGDYSTMLLSEEY